jgi:hypothetical protein
VLPSLPLACQTSALLVSYAPGNGVPSRTRTSNLEFRTLPLFTLSYRDGNQPLAGLFHPLTSRRAGSLDLLCVRGYEMVRASGNAPDPGTHLVRFRL